MYVVWLLVFWRNVLNVSNFYIKCKSILNKGGLFPLRVFLLILQNDCYTMSMIVRVHFYCSTNDQTVSCYIWLLTRQVNQQREVFYLLRRGRRLMGDYCPACEYRKAGAIHHLDVGTRCRCHLLKDNSVSFHFTYSGSVSTHFTSILTIATRGGSGTPALSPSAVPSAGSASTPSSPRFRDGTNRCRGFQLP